MPTAYPIMERRRRRRSSSATSADIVDLGLRIAAVVAEEELVEVSAASGLVERVEVGRDVQQRPDGPGDRQHDAPVGALQDLSLIHISEPTRLLSNSYAVFCL